VKTHSLANALRSLADALEAQPNMEISELGTVFGSRRNLDPREVAVNLRTLHALSKIGKQEWVKLIEEYGFEIEFNARDSSRNILGKLLNYLDSNPEALDALKRKAKDGSDKPSALRQALDILLGEP
jgi:hypothetical protein